MSMCLVIISKNSLASEIYELNNLFYLTVKVEPYRDPAPHNIFHVKDSDMDHGTVDTARVASIAVAMT